MNKKKIDVFSIILQVIMIITIIGMLVCLVSMLTGCNSPDEIAINAGEKIVSKAKSSAGSVCTDECKKTNVNWFYILGGIVLLCAVGIAVVAKSIPRASLCAGFSLPFFMAPMFIETMDMLTKPFYWMILITGGIIFGAFIIWVIIYARSVLNDAIRSDLPNKHKETDKIKKAAHSEGPLEIIKDLFDKF